MAPHEKSALKAGLNLRQRAGMLMRGGVTRDNDLQVGLLPSGGWRKRNYHFIRRILLPQIFSRRGGATQRPWLHEPPDEALRVTWIGHASFLVQTGGANILIDPVWSRWLGVVKRVRHPGLEIDDLPPIHAVLITHAHYDHLHLRALKKIGMGQPILVPRGVGHLVRRRGFGQIIEMDTWDRVRMGPLDITFTPSKHWGARHVHDVHRQFGGFHVRNEAGRTVFHCGDSAYFSGFSDIARLGKIDLALLPIGAYDAMSGREVHMNPEEALDAFRDLGADHMVPMHYGTFPLGCEPMHEPLDRLMAAGLEQGLDKAITVLQEGVPVSF